MSSFLHHFLKILVSEPPPQEVRAPAIPLPLPRLSRGRPAPPRDKRCIVIRWLGFLFSFLEIIPTRFHHSLMKTKVAEARRGPGPSLLCSAPASQGPQRRRGRGGRPVFAERLSRRRTPLPPLLRLSRLPHSTAFAAGHRPDPPVLPSSRSFR